MRNDNNLCVFCLLVYAGSDTPRSIPYDSRASHAIDLIVWTIFPETFQKWHFRLLFGSHGIFCFFNFIKDYTARGSPFLGTVALIGILWNLCEARYTATGLISYNLSQLAKWAYSKILQIFLLHRGSLEVVFVCLFTLCVYVYMIKADRKIFKKRMTISVIEKGTNRRGWWEVDTNKLNNTLESKCSYEISHLIQWIYFNVLKGKSKILILTALMY